MAWSNLATRSTSDANASADVNTLMENIRVIGGNSTSVPDTTIQDIYDNIGDYVVTSGAGVPGTTPATVGDKYIDTTGNRVYIATGTSSSADWEKQAKYEYGITTITGGSGDVTVTLDWDWSNGFLYMVMSETASEYFNGDSAPGCFHVTTYDSVTDNEATYSTDHRMALTTAPTIAVGAKTNNTTGVVKSATTTTFVFDDDGANTRYMKWMVIA